MGNLLCWTSVDARAWVMNLTPGGADWLEVRRSEGPSGETWRVDTRLDGHHYKVSDAFATKERAQGCALLFAMRLLPGHRAALQAQLDAVPGAFWWKITPVEGAAAESRSIFSSRVKDTPEEAERSGRAVGAGWWLFVYGPGSVRALGLQPR